MVHLLTDDAPAHGQVRYTELWLLFKPQVTCIKGSVLAHVNIHKESNQTNTECYIGGTCGRVQPCIWQAGGTPYLDHWVVNLLKLLVHDPAFKLLSGHGAIHHQLVNTIRNQFRPKCRGSPGLVLLCVTAQILKAGLARAAIEEEPLNASQTLLCAASRLRCAGLLSTDPRQACDLTEDDLGLASWGGKDSRRRPAHEQT